MFHLNENNYYRDLFDNAPDMYFSVDATTEKIRDCNQTAVRWLGFESKSEIVGENLTSLYHNDTHEHVRLLFQQFKATGVVESDNVLIRSRQGRVLSASLKATAVYDPNGKIAYSRSILRNNSRRDQASQFEWPLDAQRIQAYACDGQRAACIAHDVQNSLTAVQASFDHLRTALPDKWPKDTPFDRITVGLDNAFKLLRKLLEYPALMQLRDEKLDLHNVVKAANLIVADSIPRNIAVSIGEAPPIRVQADETQLQRVFINLINNAVEAIGKRGGKIDIRVRQDCANVVVEVIDDGPGMHPDVCSRIFQPYFTTKLGGCGLGLAASLDIVRSLGGTISVKSQVGEGTRVEVRLPCCDSQSRKNVIEKKVESPIVFILDDDETLRISWEALLQVLGYEVESSGDPNELFQRHEMLRNSPCVVLIDQCLGSSTGLDIVKEIRSAGLDVPIVLTSGRPWRSMDELLRLGVFDFILKPATSSELDDTLRRAIGSRQL